ncbi:MAG: hypothetical protein JWN45_1875 [Acidobacteriaceae bacterium]|nr:hypothetical protein [Acidobacteriaceae bacterium]
MAADERLSFKGNAIVEPIAGTAALAIGHVLEDAPVGLIRVGRAAPGLCLGMRSPSCMHHAEAPV